MALNVYMSLLISKDYKYVFSDYHLQEKKTHKFHDPKSMALIQISFESDVCGGKMVVFLQLRLHSF